MKKPIPYSEAMAQVEALVRKIEQGEVDVDDLADSVKRAAALLSDCRSRLRTAQDAVEDALKALEEPTGPAAASTTVKRDASGTADPFAE